MAKPRLFVEKLDRNQNEIEIEGDAHHYLARVMRMKAGQDVAIFDGLGDSLNAEILEVSKSKTHLRILGVEMEFMPPPDLELAFAPIKKARTDFIVEKAAELGVRSIQPIKTDFTNSERIKPDRLLRHAIEAVEQCGGNYVPELRDWISLDEYLQSTSRQLLFCDETAPKGEGESEFAKASAESWGILIGPEGGFSQGEREKILDKGALRLSLGPRILRADTAAVAAMTLWQNQHGDWH